MALTREQLIDLNSVIPTAICELDFDLDDLAYKQVKDSFVLAFKKVKQIKQKLHTELSIDEKEQLPYGSIRDNLAQFFKTVNIAVNQLSELHFGRNREQAEHLLEQWRKPLQRAIKAIETLENDNIFEVFEVLLDYCFDLNKIHSNINKGLK